MAYNPGGQPPFNPQAPFGAPPPPPPKAGMSTGVKVAIFGCIGLVFIGAIITIIAVIVGMNYMPTNSNSSSSGSNSAPTPSTRNDTAASNSNASPAAPSGGDTAGVNVASIEMAKDDNGQPGDTVISFSPTDNPMHFVIRLDESVQGTKVRVVLKAVSVASGEKNVTVGELDYVTKSFENRVNAQFELPQDWPTGQWRVEVYINGKLDETKDFNVV